MEINIDRLDNAVIVSAGSRLDGNSSAAFQESLTKLAAAEPTIIIDMSGFNYVSSAGLRALLIVSRQCKSAGNNLALCGLTPDVSKVFDISGLLPMFAVFANTDEAVAAFS